MEEESWEWFGRRRTGRECHLLAMSPFGPGVRPGTRPGVFDSGYYRPAARSPVERNKWAWLLQQDGDLDARAVAGELYLGTVDSWLLFNLTGGAVHATDHTNASRTALLGLESLAWEDALLRLFGIPRAALAKVQPSCGHFGDCNAIPELEGVPIMSMIGDSHAALVGHGCHKPGTVKATYGTGSSLMMLTQSLAGKRSCWRAR